MPTTSLSEDLFPQRNKELYYTPPLNPNNDETQDFLIYMIPGNPGLISYYEPFLAAVHSLLLSSPTSRSANFYICGHSLTGFDTLPDRQGYESPVGLSDQIIKSEKLLYDHINEHRQSNAARGKSLKVILMGHSVGAYILLELIRQHRQKIEEGEEDFDLIGGILLFPTITHLAKSPSGLVASKLLSIPHVAFVAGAFVKALFFLVPANVLYYIIKVVMRMPEHAAKTTTSFIKSPMGVRQALHLAKDEMDIINEDKWEEEVWGAATSAGTNSQDTASSNLIFYWGQNDRWVAGHTRDDLISARGYRNSKKIERQLDDWKPTMLIDREKIPHAFCLNQSDIVAKKVKNWVEEIIVVHTRESASK